jgi:hypothetical protein
MNPVCSASCNSTIAKVKFSHCAPEVVFSEIRRMFLAKDNAASFANWQNATEWLNRVDNDNVTGDDYIRVFTVIADKPAPSSVRKDISNGRKITIGKDHVLNFTIDDVSQENYDWMRSTECGGRYKLWYETSGGFMYGGNDGIPVDLDVNDILNRGTEEIETLAGIAAWRNKFSPERVASAIFDEDFDDSDAPTTYDTVQIFPGATFKTDAGVTTTVPAADPELKFEFNAISPRIGSPANMVLKLAGASVANVDFPTDYSGTGWKFTDKDGGVHYGNFSGGTKNL